MKYRHHRSAKIVITWAFATVLTSAVFLELFFFRQRMFVPVRAAVKPTGFKLVKAFPFLKEDSLKEWEEKVFKGKVVYRIEKEGDASYVRALSDAASSALYYRIKMDARNRHPMIRWKWRVEKFPAKSMAETLERKEEDDFAARMYVIFPAMFITNWKVLEYIWTETIPAGTTGTSPLSKNIKLIVLEQGLSKDKKWASEERDIYSDYVKLFGRVPEHNIGAIAFMTNTEHTGTSADAAYGDIEIGYMEDPGDKKERGRP